MTNDTQSGEVARLRAALQEIIDVYKNVPIKMNSPPFLRMTWIANRRREIAELALSEQPQPAERTDSELVAAMNLPPSVGWQVHVIGPDDIHKCSSYDEAIQEARGINEISAKFNAEHPGNEILCLAYVRPIWIDDAMDSEKEGE